MDQELDELLKWAAEHGAHDSVSAPLLHQAGHLPRQSRRNERRSCLETTLAVATFPEAGGRGLAATRDLTAGEALLAVPEQLLMTAKSARTDAILGPLLTRSPGLTSHQVLIVHLLHEVAKGAASFWRPYLLALPRVHHTLAHFSAPQVLHLQFPHAMEAARRARTEAHRDWAAAAPLLQDLGLPPKFRRFKAWLWAAATVTSRSVAIPFDSAGALCPVGDLFNYAAPSEEDQTARLTDGAFDAETRCFRFYARENYRTGQQVLLCYGAYRNLDLLEHYGFLLPDNPNDAVTILLPASLLPKAACEQQRSHVHSAELEMRSECHVRADGQPSFGLLSALRLRAASALDRKRYGHLASAGMRISVEGDVRTYEWLESVCQLLLQDLPTSLESDLALHDKAWKPVQVALSNPEQQGPITHWCKENEVCERKFDFVDELISLAFCWRIGQKHILARAKLHARSRLKELKSNI